MGPEMPDATVAATLEPHQLQLISLAAVPAPVIIAFLLVLGVIEL